MTAQLSLLDVRYAVHPCRDDGPDFTERCAEAEAEYWSVYEVDEDGEELWVSDHATRAEAEAAAARPILAAEHGTARKEGA